jgi:hypothetical protein
MESMLAMLVGPLRWKIACCFDAAKYAMIPQ